MCQKNTLLCQNDSPISVWNPLLLPKNSCVLSKKRLLMCWSLPKIPPLPVPLFFFLTKNPLCQKKSIPNTPLHYHSPNLHSSCCMVSGSPWSFIRLGMWLWLHREVCDCMEKTSSLLGESCCWSLSPSKQHDIPGGYSSTRLCMFSHAAVCVLSCGYGDSFVHQLFQGCSRFPYGSMWRRKSPSRVRKGLSYGARLTLSKNGSCVDEELMRKLEVDQSWRFRNRDANVAVSFPFLSSMRAENVSKMVRLVDGRLPNGAIAPLSWSESVSTPLQNLVHLHSKIWCIPPFKNPIIPPSKIWSSFPSKIWCILLKIWSSFSSKKVQHDQNSSSVPQESAKNPSFHTCFHLATVEILQYVDYPDLSHVCWPLTILAWWHLPSFLYRILSKFLYLVMIFSPWWLQVSCKN